MRMIKHPAPVSDRKRTSLWALVAVTGAIGFGFGWIGAKASQPAQAEGSAVVEPVDDGSAVVATIEEVRSRPEDFSGKRVRLTGQLDDVTTGNARCVQNR
jgi:hypothetical protein